VEGFGLDDHKTKTFLTVAKNFGWDNKTLIVETAPEKNLILSSRNVQGVTVASNANINIYDVLYHDKIVFTKDAISALEERLK
jgi:large subunit ribosomal protein L4